MIDRLELNNKSVKMGWGRCANRRCTFYLLGVPGAPPTSDGEFVSGLIGEILVDSKLVIPFLTGETRAVEAIWVLSEGVVVVFRESFVLSLPDFLVGPASLVHSEVELCLRRI